MLKHDMVKFETSLNDRSHAISIKNFSIVGICIINWDSIPNPRRSAWPWSAGDEVSALPTV